MAPSAVGFVGGDVFVRGELNGFRKFFARHPRKDRTGGCVSVPDARIREIWSLAPTGARIVIHP